MDLRELIERLKPYPILQSVVLGAMTEEEYEQYVDSLPDAPPERPGLRTVLGLGETPSREEVDAAEVKVWEEAKFCIRDTLGRIRKVTGKSGKEETP